MTRYDIIKMAREAGLCWQDGEPMIAVDRLERFVALVAADEREACAQIADEEAQLFGITDDVVAHRIRERGEDRFEIKEDRIHKDLPGRRVAKAAGARIEE